MENFELHLQRMKEKSTQLSDRRAQIDSACQQLKEKNKKLYDEIKMEIQQNKILKQQRQAEKEKTEQIVHAQEFLDKERDFQEIHQIFKRVILEKRLEGKKEVVRCLKKIHSLVQLLDCLTDPFVLKFYIKSSQDPKSLMILLIKLKENSDRSLEEMFSHLFNQFKGYYFFFYVTEKILCLFI